jgi:UDP-N-acetylglucosamine acyltransferase
MSCWRAIARLAILLSSVARRPFQFAVGAHAFLGSMSGLEQPHPYGMALKSRVSFGLNIIGLQRRGFAREDIHNLRRAYRLLFADEGTLVERVEDVEKEFAGNPIVTEIVAFIRAGGKRSLCTPHTEP